MFKAYLTSLRSIRIFMLSFGIIMGVIFPFYSAIFFGSAAFTPLYVIGCIIAGLLVGSFCSAIIKQALQIQLQYQFDALARISKNTALEYPIVAGDELESLQACHRSFLDRVVSMVNNVAEISRDYITKCNDLTDTSHKMVEGNETHSVKEYETLESVAKVNEFFRALVHEIEELSVRSDEHSSFAGEINSTTDSIAQTIRNYSDSVLNTSASIEEMAANLKEIAGNIEALSSSTEQTSSSIQQITTAINNVRDNTQRAVESSVNVRMLAQDGMRAMTATLKAMHEIEQSTEDSFNAIGRLSVYSARVGEFVKMIQEVVEQTNLLALNASIIAAQAGNRGRAFAVVADEVRLLAHRTASSASEIQELVKNIQKETAAVQRAIAIGKDRGKSGVKISAMTSDALAKIELTSTEVAQMIQKIAATTVKQASGSRVIGEEAEKNLERVRQVTRSIKEQERGTTLVVSALEDMRDLSHKVISSTQEQTKGTHVYLQSVIEDNDRMKQLRKKAMEQLKLSNHLKTCIEESGVLTQENVRNSKEIFTQIDILAKGTQRLRQEILPFSGQEEEASPSLPAEDF
ncbi:putative methyl-accepting chemotaxis protein YoaH [Geobacter sp. OR-1]|uniref:methyl-accepting chemotaxis protein n=1 Tax=Geobacter sp. OR-1 TaxID=1266765 RepID=UPI000541DCB2|nr:methyl-accepting chemotaxis protein [Geobacter sp. OR-1]GAM09708.1 putative methyl-accepting chemotaxis protein YoaH [Geobacter sp. OR-1]